MQNNNDQNERVRPKLESASELKGKKAGGKKTASIGKKRAATFISLVLVLALAVGAYFVTDALAPEVVEEEQQSTGSSYFTMLEGHSKTDMASFTVVENGAAKYTIHSNLKEKAEIVAAEEAAATAAEGESTEEKVSAADAIPDYVLDGADWFTLDTDTVNPMVTYSYSMVSAKQIEEGAEDLEKYGLTNPKMYVDYTYHDGTTMRLNFGDKVPAGDYHYVTLNDSTDVYMLYKSVRGYFDRPVEELHVMPETAVLNSDETGFSYLLAEHRGAETIEIEMRDDEMSIFTMWLKQPIDYATNVERSTEVMTGAAALKLTGYIAHAQTEEELAEYGLAEPFANVIVTDDDGLTIAMTIGDTVKGDAAYRYAIVDETGDIYTVDVNLLSFLNNCRVSYLVDQFTNLVNIKKIDGFTIEGDGKTYTSHFVRTDYTDEDGTERTHEEFYLNDQFIDEDTFRAFYQVVVGTLFDKRIEDPAEYTFDGDVVLTLTYDLNYADEDYVVEYLDYDRDYYASRKDGYTLFLVRKDKVDLILENAQQLLDGTFTYDDGYYDPGAED